MTKDSRKSLTGTIRVRKTGTTILFSVGALLFYLVIVSLFAFSSPFNSFVAEKPKTFFDNEDKNLDLSNGFENHNGECDLYKGKWIYDEAGPLYTSNSCPIITHNCQGNGRPDKGYENWRWKPNDGCDLPRFQPKKFLELMRGKTLGFIGDSVARNQFESLICMLWQAEAPEDWGNKRMQRLYFRSTSTLIVRIWSSWSVHTNSDPIGTAPKGIDKVFLDVPDKSFMDFVPGLDVLVLSSGHWYAKKSAYVLDGAVVRGHLWWPKNAGTMRVNNIDAFGISTETALTALAQNSNFTGLAIVRSYSPDHYANGAWNTGGSCSDKTEPAKELIQNNFTTSIYSKQIQGFRKVVEKAENNSKWKLMDVTGIFGLRHDGHPGSYREPKKKPNGVPPSQDCLHWCMPGPVDTWNEMLLEIIRREFEDGD